jgi:ankyrin repeat protein
MLLATRNGDVKRVSELLEKNSDLFKAKDWIGNTALIIAGNSGRRAVAELLFKAGVQPDIYEAAAIGETARVAELLNEDFVRLDLHSAEGFPPLLLAATFGHRETTEYLLDQGANINITSLPPTEATALHAALFEGQIETARLLIERGADVTIKRGNNGWPRAGWTALHYAAGCGLAELIEPLIACGADLCALDEDGRTPLDVAIEEKQYQTAEALRQKTV